LVIVDLKQGVHSIEVRGRLGKPNLFGEVYCGWSQFGDENVSAGYYQRRPRPCGQIIVRMRHYFPDCGHTERQEEVRGIFADGVSAWKALSESEKQVWNMMKWPRRMSGFCRHQRQYLKDHTG